MKGFVLAALGFIAVSAIQLDQEMPTVLAQTRQETTTTGGSGDDCIPCSATSDFTLSWTDGYTGGCVATRSDISCCPDQCVAVPE